MSSTNPNSKPNSKPKLERRPRRGVEEYLAPDVQASMRDEIRAAGNHEVFFVCNTTVQGLVCRAQAFARGNEHSVPALLNRCMPHDVVVHNHPGGDLTPSDADLAVASQLGNESVGFYIVDNDARSIYVVVEPFPRGEGRPAALDPAILDDLGPGGALARTLPGFEHRAEQVALARAVLEAFNEGKVLTAEAGTGTGKSFAYLIPALRWAEKTGERVVIATHTISLQEQLLHKDIPLLERALDLDVAVELVKGRSNYVCKRKLAAVSAEPRLHAEPEDQELLDDLIAWAGQSADGTLSDLSWVPRYDLWDKIVSEADTTLGVKCEHYQSCFFNSARRRAGRARVLLVNHHLLCADLAIRSSGEGGLSYGLLPRFDRVILDEAHHIEDVASQYFGETLTRAGLMRLLSRIHREGRREGGVLPLIRSKLTSRGERGRELMDRIDAHLAPEVIAVQDLLEELFTALWGVLTGGGRTVEEGAGDPGELKLRLRPGVLEGERFQEEVLPASGKARGRAIRLARELAALVEDLETPDPAAPDARDVAQEGADELEAPRVLLKAYAGRLRDAMAALDSILAGEDENSVAWIEGRELQAGRYRIRLTSCPVEVSSNLESSLFRRFRTVVMTSATLSVQDSFEHFHDRVGVELIEPERRGEARFPSPFDFPTQAMLGIPADLPDPASPEFLPACVTFLKDALTAARGGAFVLTTSFRMLRSLAASLRDPLGRAGHPVLVQGEIPRTQLLDQFRRCGSAVLFGTSSFWEGVDVPGDALRMVVLAKLPFQVPTDPVVEARLQAIERRGGNSFRDYSLPQAVIRLRQGFGRLIRTETDRGAVLILDRRLVSRPYGRIFLASLPPARREIAPARKVLDAVRGFFHGGLDRPPPASID